jgi:predicted dehydrogenase
MTAIRVAIVGGGIGRAHIEGYRALGGAFDIAAICDLDIERARALAAEFGIARAMADLASLLDDPAIELIDLCTPPATHADLIERVLRAGKPVICEKPLVGSLAEIDRLEALERETGRQVMPVFQYRYGTGVQKLKRLIEAGVPGRHYLTTIEIAWRRGADYYAVPWRGKWASELGGVTVTHAIHFYDLLIYLLGPVRSVHARLATRVNPIEVEDCAVLSFELADGSFATLAATLGSEREISRIRCCFDGLTAESGGSEPYNPGAEPWRFDPAPALAARAAEALEDFKEEPESFAGLFYRYAESRRTGKPLPVTLADARRALEIITAIYLSAETGRSGMLPIEPGNPKYAAWIPPARQQE